MLYYKELFFFSTFSVYCCKITLIRQLNSTPGPCHCHHGYIIFFFDQIISLAHISSHTTLRPLNILFVFQLLTSLTCPTRVYLGELLIHCFSHLILTHSLGRWPHEAILLAAAPGIIMQLQRLLQQQQQVPQRQSHRTVNKIGSKSGNIWGNIDLQYSVLWSAF